MIGNPYPKSSKKISGKLLKVAVVCLGFGINLHEAMQTGKNGFVITFLSISTVMLLGFWLGKRLNINNKTAYLISSGTAICGGSAIAAVGPAIDAKEVDMSVSLVTIFLLNAVALLIFPPLGHLFGLNEHQFGLWAAISIHDTSSVVGAGAAYGPEALKIATTVKLTRALWVIPLVLASAFIFHNKSKKIALPWFILFFVLAMFAAAYLPIPKVAIESIVYLSKRMLTLTLFLIGAGLSTEALKVVGVKPLLMGVILWFVIGVIGFLLAWFLPII
jgi:uncharacterized integral membrane protein (TIGR00698 family)